MEINKIIQGDCLKVMKTFPDNSVDLVLTDPPYGLEFMGKKWDKFQRINSGRNRGINEITAISRGPDKYEAGKPFQEFCYSWATECLRLLKPGGFLLSFGGTRTYHRMVCGIEDARFEIRDMINWIYGCLSEDTEVLTINGWERYHKNIYKYPILIYNNGIYQWEIPKKWNEYQVNDTCYRIKSDKTDQLVSRNHRVAVEQDGRILFKFAETLECEENIPFLESVPSLSKSLPYLYKGTSNKEQSMFSEMCKLPSSIQEEEINNLFNRKKMFSVWKNIYRGENEEILFLPMQWENENKGFAEERKTHSSNERGNETKIKDSIFRREEPFLEGRSNIFQNSWKLCRGKICSLSERIYSYGSEGWLCNGTPIANGKETEQMFVENRGSSSQRPQSNEQSDRKSNFIQEQQSSQNLRGYGVTKAKVTKEEYSGLIFCPTISTGCFVARRKGKIFITGNSGFPKSLNIGKQIDKLQGNEREFVGLSKNEIDFRDVGKKVNEIEGIDKLSFGLIENAERKDLKITKGKSIGEGYGTALKPACEPIVVARKPLSEKNVALNVLKWGTGGLNIDGCRIGNREKEQFIGEKRPKNVSNTNCYGDYDYDKSTTPLPAGRFPSNIILNEIAGKMLDEQSGINKSKKQIMGRGFDNSEVYGTGDLNYKSERGHNDKGGASRFFYCAKASKNERGENNKHPTIKPIKLMQYLVRLATPKNGIVLDPFGGSGTTAIACIKEHKNYILIEKESEYVEIAKTRLNKIEKSLNNYD